MKVRIEIVDNSVDASACRRLIADVYGAEYGVTFSETEYRLDECVERWPQRFLRAVAEGETIATFGLYQQDTYVERFGNVSLADVEMHIEAAGLSQKYRAEDRCEYTKLVVHPEWRGLALSRRILHAAHARAFIEQDTLRPKIILFCMRRSNVRRLHGNAGVRCRIVKPFPSYPVHERYRSLHDPMHSYLVLPVLDVPVHIHELQFPIEFEIGGASSRDEPAHANLASA
jgi:GNAT superfamily N-acetyltransferase